MWLLFTIFNTIIYGCLDMIEKKGSKEQPMNFWAIGILTYGFLNLLVGTIISPNLILNIDSYSFLIVLPVSLLSTIGYYCSIKAYKNSSISSVSPIMRSKIIIVLILSSIFIKDKLSIFQIIIIFILLILNILLNKDTNSKRTKKGILYAIGFMIANGGATFLNKIAINALINPINVTFYTGLTSIFSIFFILFIFNKLELLNLKSFKNKTHVFCMETIEVIAALLLRYALISGNVAIITAITSSSVIISVILSYIFMKDKINTKKWIIISLIIICLIILSIISI